MRCEGDVAIENNARRGTGDDAKAKKRAAAGVGDSHTPHPLWNVIRCRRFAGKSRDRYDNIQRFRRCTRKSNTGMAWKCGVGNNVVLSGDDIDECDSSAALHPDKTSRRGPHFNHLIARCILQSCIGGNWRLREAAAAVVPCPRQQRLMWGNAMGRIGCSARGARKQGFCRGMQLLQVHRAVCNKRDLQNVIHLQRKQGICAEGLLEPTSEQRQDT